MKYTKKYIESKLPELREIKIYTKEPAYPKKISDKILVDALCVLVNSRGLSDEFDFVDGESWDNTFSDSTANHLLSEKYVKEAVEKYKKEKFDLKSIYAKVCKEAFEVTNIKSELNHDVVVGSYWIGEQNIFPGLNFKEKVENYNLRGSIINNVMSYVCKHRNLPNAKFANSFQKKDLIGKFVVTEENILYGFMKSMTLKYNGFLPGEIIETRYGERHGLDNFWDDSVPSRDFLVLKLNNITGSKSISNLKDGLWAIDLTKTLQVFDTMEEAVELANQLNEFNKKSLTLD